MGNAVPRIGLIFAALLSARTFAAPITTVLHLQERVSMEQLARNVFDPHSDHYQRFYEPTEIRALAAPTDAQYNDLLNGLKADGFTVVSESPTHLWVTVRAEKAVYESLFNTKIQPMANGRHQALTRAQVPVHLSLVQSVSGLDSTQKRHPKYVRRGGEKSFGGGISPATIRTIYGFDPIYSSGVTGLGQHIAIATYDDFKIDNAKYYYKSQKLSPGPTLDKVEFNGKPNYDEGSSGETELDAEFSGMIAPGASIHVFTSASNDDAGELAMFTAILDDNRSKVVNYSWGSCEDMVEPEHKANMEAVFQRAVAQGVNITVASGDSGSDSCQDGSRKADWPAAAPYIVAVGGTSVYPDGNGGMREKAWGGSGGGISDIWDLPSWQQGLGTPFAKRSYPDVSFNADPYTGQACYTGPQGRARWEIVGGTSMAAPQWAGFLALVGQARQTAGKGDLGYLSPYLYGFTSQELGGLMNDITSGDNGGYRAGKGWDAVTGFGSMRADALLKKLQSF